MAMGSATSQVWAGASAPNVYHDAIGDVSVRRTDPGNDGPIDQSSVLPDIISISLSGWAPFQPASDPYTGVTVSGVTADIFRLDLVLNGLMNPPGTLALGAEPWDPYRFGESPVYGFIEFDIDRDRDTGGELGGSATQRYLANVGRFASIPEGSISNRMATSASDIDLNFSTSPQYERSGQDFSLNLCGCFNVTLVDNGGDTNTTFDPGDTWIVSGRFFQRAGGYEQASAVFGGTFFGLYDPVVQLRFSHDITTNTTTVSLVYALTMTGSAAVFCL